MRKNLIVSIKEELLDSIFEGAKRLYPRETFLLLRGNKSRKEVRISDLIIPPLAVYGQGFANIPLHMLPMDFSVIGTVHSHPSGNIMPSNVDLNHFFGSILMIVGFPFSNIDNVAVFNAKGEKLKLVISSEKANNL